MEQFKTRIQFAEDLGMNVLTLIRKLAKKGYEFPPGLISPTSQEEAREILNDHIEKTNPPKKR